MPQAAGSGRTIGYRIGRRGVPGAYVRIKRVPKKLNPTEVKQVKRIVGADAELKQQVRVVGAASATAGSQAFTTPPSYTQASGWLIGTTGAIQGTRIGDRIRLKKLIIRFQLYSNILSSLPVRIILFMDNANNGGAAVTNADLFADTAAADCTNWPININNSKRYSILFDRRFTMNNISTIATLTTIKLYGYTKSFSGLGKLIQFNNANAGDNSDIISGALYLCFMSANNANVGTCSYDITLLYTDA